MRNKNIVHLVTPYLFHTGSWIYTQLTGIKSYNKHVFTQNIWNDPQFPFEPVYSVENFNKLKYNLNRVYRRITDRYGLFFNPLVKNIKPDLFHAHFGFEGWKWLRLAKKNEIPLITTFYGFDVSQFGRDPKWRSRYKELFDYGTLFLGEGSHLRQQIIDLGCEDKKVKVQHLGVDVDRYPKKVNYNLDSDDISVLQVSSPREKKGIKYSLLAIAEVIKLFPNIKYKLIGGFTGKNLIEEEIHSLIKKLDISKNVILLGSKTHNEVVQEMFEADIFLHPSVTASDGDNEGGAPVGISEASAIGLPIVSTFHCDIPEVVIDGKTGLLSKEKDEEAIANNIVKLIEDPLLRKRLGETGIKHITENYNLKKQLVKLEGIYNEISK